MHSGVHRFILYRHAEEQPVHVISPETSQSPPSRKAAAGCFYQAKDCEQALDSKAVGTRLDTGRDLVGDGSGYKHPLLRFPSGSLPSRCTRSDLFNG